MYNAALGIPSTNAQDKFRGNPFSRFLAGKRLQPFDWAQDKLKARPFRFYEKGNAQTKRFRQINSTLLM